MYNKTAKTNVMLLKRQEPSYEKKIFIRSLAAAVAMSATACTSNPCRVKNNCAPAETKAEETTAAEASSEGEKKEAAADGDLITVGYAQVGS